MIFLIVSQILELRQRNVLLELVKFLKVMS